MSLLDFNGQLVDVRIKNLYIHKFQKDLRKRKTARILFYLFGMRI